MATLDEMVDKKDKLKGKLFAEKLRLFISDSESNCLQACVYCK